MPRTETNAGILGATKPLKHGTEGDEVCKVLTLNNKQMKRINRKEFLQFLKTETKTENITQQSFTGNNIYFLTGVDKEDVEFQIEFISSKKYPFTVLLRGLKREADFLHDKAKNYLLSLKLGRDIVLDTESKVTLL